MYVAFTAISSGTMLGYWATGRLQAFLHHDHLAIDRPEHHRADLRFTVWIYNRDLVAALQFRYRLPRNQQRIGNAIDLSTCAHILSGTQCQLRVGKTHRYLDRSGLLVDLT